MLKSYEAPAENKAYMAGYVKGRQEAGKADDMLFWQVRSAVDAARDLYHRTVAEKDARIRELEAALEKERREKEELRTDYESRELAHRIAWRHRGEAL